jgi:hypothetical protein
MFMTRDNLKCCAAFAMVAACSGADREDDPSHDGPSIPGADGGSESGADDGAPDERFDVANDGESGDNGGDNSSEECGKVDFVFTIDSSNSMDTNQAELIASFPEFVASIQGTLEQVDSHHVGVVTSDAYPFNEAGCTSYGALVTQTGGKDSSMRTCGPFSGGARFMTEADDLPAAFACAAQVGTGGANDERMMLAAGEAVAPEANATGACNEGFIRDDALLVLVLITDEDDPGMCVGAGMDCQGSPGDPQAWHDHFVAIKGGNPENVVVLTLVRGVPGNVCGFAEGTELDGSRLMRFTSLFGDHGFVGDICARSFGPFFDEAVAIIDVACGEFVPPAS